MSSAASSTFDSSSTKDNFIPLFSGQPSEYKEWRKRILIYQRKMVLSKRASEGVLNLIGSQTGTAWSLLEDFPLENLELESTFNAVLKILDAAFQYDDRVQLPSDFEAYFMRFQRKHGQTLLAYCTEHEELIKRLDRHKVTLPGTIQGWLILRRAGLSKEQRQLVTTQVPNLEKKKVIETLYLLFGQDFKETPGRPADDRRWHRGGKGRGYAAYDDEADDYWDDGEYDESVYYGGGDDWGELLEEDASVYDHEDFDAGAAYYEDDGHEDPVPFDVAEYDEAFAAYTDARRRFNDRSCQEPISPSLRSQIQVLATSHLGLLHRPLNRCPTPKARRMDLEKEKVAEVRKEKEVAATRTATLVVLASNLTLVEVLVLH